MQLLTATGLLVAARACNLQIDGASPLTRPGHGPVDLEVGGGVGSPADSSEQMDHNASVSTLKRCTCLALHLRQCPDRRYSLPQLHRCQNDRCP